jgi:hypothetical protein
VGEARSIARIVVVALVAYPGARRIRLRLLQILQTLHVSDKTAAFYGENEIVRRCVIPLLIGGRTLQRVKRAIIFNGVFASRCKVQLPVLRQVGRVEFSAPGTLSPSGYTDRRFGHDFKAVTLRSLGLTSSLFTQFAFCL